MTKYKTSSSIESEQASMKAAKATQRPGQTKEQTKLIAQGIQKGIEHYKKQQKSKSREFNKKLKRINKAKDTLSQSVETDQSQPIPNTRSPQKLPWVLLLLSWVLFASYLLV